VARELGVDIDSVPTDDTWDGEAYVTEEAVRSYAERRHAALADSPAEGAKTPDETAAAASVSDAAREQRRQAVDGESATESVPETPSGAADETVEKVVDAPRPTRREPYRGVRRTIGERMAQSKREIPHATHHDLAEVSELVEARERLKPLAEKRGVKLTYLPFVLKSVAARCGSTRYSTRNSTKTPRRSSTRSTTTSASRPRRTPD